MSAPADIDGPNPDERTYAVHELIYTLQGEGAHAGRAAVFCRFSGCNLWTGRAADRDRGQADCSRWCDTVFVGPKGPGGGRYSRDALVEAAAALWSDNATASDRAMIVCTGGEPLLQLDDDLVAALHEAGFYVAVETNGTLPVPDTVDWVCVSPKSRAPMTVSRGNELKLVHPQPGLSPDQFEHLSFEHWFVQPLDSAELSANTALCVNFCRTNPRWRLSLQAHKLIGIP